ncbi:hypothetical protein G6F59_017895 [Rhizopus arrhizus]|nr:hypothetical protein G6F59_017895 [Rhizopus arrhizus]
MGPRHASGGLGRTLNPGLAVCAGTRTRASRGQAPKDGFTASPATGPTPPSLGMRLLLSTLLARWPLQAPGAARPIPLNRQATAGTGTLCRHQIANVT